MAQNTLRLASIPADDWSGRASTSLSEQCKVSVSPASGPDTAAPEVYSLAICDYNNLTQVIGSTTFPEVDYNLTNGVFIISADQTNGVLGAMARVHKNAEAIARVELSLPYTIDDLSAEIQSVKVHSSSNTTNRMTDMIGPHQILPGGTIPLTVCSPFNPTTEREVTVVIPEAGTANPILRIDITDFLKSEPSDNLAIALSLEVEVVAPDGVSPGTNTKVNFSAAQATVEFRYNQATTLPVLEVYIPAYNLNKTYTASGLMLTVDRNAETMHLGLSYSHNNAVVSPPSFHSEFEDDVVWHATTDGGATNPITVNAEVTYATGQNKIPSYQFSGGGTTKALDISAFNGDWGTGWAQPSVSFGAVSGLTVLILTDPAYDPSTASMFFDVPVGTAQLYSSTGVPKAAELDALNILVQFVDAGGQPFENAYGTTQVSVILD